MVFSSLPLYHLDPPPNWAQEQLHQQQPGRVIHTQSSQVPPLLKPPPPPLSVVGGGSGDGGHHRGSTKSGSMADRARLAKIAQPEAALKCPRCESTNTKFCYYNNYSLSQPRHFCKTCRRYWTRGGALRNVPVGGGCRRKNKRSKASNSNRSKSPNKAAAAAASGSISNPPSANNSTTSCCPRSDHHHLIGHLPSPLLFPPTTSHSYSDYDVVFAATNIKDAQFQTGCSSSGGIIGSNNNGFITTEQWKPPILQHHQQFPSTFLTNLESPIGLYQFERSENVGVEPSRTLLYSGGCGIGSDHQLTSTVKMEENREVVGLSKSLMGNSANNEQFWDVSAWNSNNISSLASSSTTHLI